MKRHLDRSIATLKSGAPTTPPPETCPLIDTLIEKRGGIMDSLACIRGEIERSRLKDRDRIADDLMSEEELLAGMRESLEELRHHNARLRNLSLYWYQVAKRLHEEGNAK